MKNFKIVLLVLILPFFAFTVMHKYYLSVTKVEYSEKDKAIQITTRIFIDDMEGLLKERYDLIANLTLDIESPSAMVYIEKYLRTKFLVKLNGDVIEYKILGKEYDDDILVAYIEIEEVKLSDIKTLEVQNDMLFDMFEEQQNVVHFKIDNKKKSFVLIRENNKGMLKL